MTTELCNTIIIHGQPTERDMDFYNQGYEAGLRRAASLFDDDLTSRYGQEADIPAIRNAILAQIKGE